MTPACTSEPISFLRLERYLQGDLQLPELERVAAHLHDCPTCSACFDEMRNEVIELPALPVQLTTRTRAPARARTWTWPLGLVAAAAALVLALLPQLSKDSRPPAARVHVKGGELAIALVREHAATLANDASVFAAGDRFEVRLSCPADLQVHWDVVVFQAGEAFFPLQPVAPLRCANGVTLPGAFELTGSAAASVCVQIDAARPIDRERVKRVGQSALSQSSACTALTPAPSRN
jgi:hypothetical protein